MKAWDVWAELLEGSARMRADRLAHPRRDTFHRSSLISAQRPKAAVLSCADSRVPVEIVFDQGFGDIFVVRNAGPVIAPITTGSLEYAISALNVPLVAVLTHVGCGAIAAAQERLPKYPGAIQAVVDHISPRVKLSDSATGPALHAADLVQALTESSPLITDRITAGTLGVVGAYYSLAQYTVTEVVRLAPTDS